MRLEDGRKFLYQWELNQKLEVPAGCVQVHFENGTFKGAISVEVTHSVNSAEATIPNELLWTAATIKCYAWDGDKVIDHVEIAVQPREKPADYIYEETEVRRFDTLLEALEKNGAYYTPVLDKEGNLSWKESLDRMPKIPGGNIKGPKGDKGDPGETVDDSKVGSDPWSSKNTVDKLCPSFMESGGVVTCEPVVGYPLTVAASEEATQIVRCGKNLFDFKQDAKEIHFNAPSGTDTLKHGYAIHLPAGTYTVHAEPIVMGTESYVFCYGNDADGKYIALADFLVNNGGSTNTWLRQGYASNCTARTFAFDREVMFYVYQGGAGTSVSSATQRLRNEHNIQIEAGSVKTDYEPFCGETFAVGVDIPALQGINYLYADRGDITVTGKADPVAIIEKLSSAVTAMLEG